MKTSLDPQPEFFELPWATPLEEWPDSLAVRLPRGRHRHIVRFIEFEGIFFALKELSSELAHREFTVLEFLKEEGLPVVDLVGVADRRKSSEGEELDAILVTRHLPYSLPYLHLFAGQTVPGLHARLVDALVILLARLHLSGVFWGDCSLGNALFRRDAGDLAAYIVDTETAELHDEITASRRQHDLDIAVENVGGGLLELDALGRLPDDVDPIEIVELLQLRYDELWTELTREDEVESDELWRVRDRLKRLNDLGFDTDEIELVERDGTSRVLFRPRVVEEGHHRRELERLTGVVAEENQARRLLSAIQSYGAWLAREEERNFPEAIVAFRWLTERFEPTIAAVPDELRGRMADAEIYHHVLDHVWYLSETAGADVGLEVAVLDYVTNVLPALPDERTVLAVDDLSDDVEPDPIME